MYALIILQFSLLLTHEIQCKYATCCPLQASKITVRNTSHLRSY